MKALKRRICCGERFYEVQIIGQSMTDNVVVSYEEKKRQNHKSLNVEKRKSFSLFAPSNNMLYFFYQAI